MSDQPQLRFDDGAAYERVMGVWSRKVGEVFLDWLRPAAGLDWLDVGCGNGAFSQLVFERCAPARLTGIDPSEGQVAYARERLSGRSAQFVLGDAMALPWPAAHFDIAVMALVIFFVPDPAKGVAEMARVAKPGGLVASYGWDIPGGGLPMEPIVRGLEALGISAPLPPHAEMGAMAAVTALWQAAGLADIQTRVIAVERRFESLEEFWAIYSSGPMALTFAALTPRQAEALKDELRRRLEFDAAGGVVRHAWANAISGRVPQ